MSAAQTIPEPDRSTYLGSHDTSAISGLNPWRKPINVYMDKLNLSLPQEPTERMRWGLTLQNPILNEFADRMGGVTLEPERLIRHPTLPWFGGTPDAIIAGRKAGVDAKNVQFNRGEWGDEGSDQVPRYILFQCHHFMTLLDYERWYVAALFGGCELRVYEVERDAELSDMIIEMDGNFWNDHIQKEIPPEIDGSEGWKKYAERMHPKDSGEVRLATFDEILLLDELRQVEDVLKEAEAKSKKLKNTLRASMADASGIDCEVAKVSYRIAKGRTDIDTTTLKEFFPDVAKQCTRIGKENRILRVTFKREE